MALSNLQFLVAACLMVAASSLVMAQADFDGFYTDNFGYGRGMFACTRGNIFTAIYSDVGFMVGTIRSDENVFGRWYEPGVDFSSSTPVEDCRYGTFQISLFFDDDDDDVMDDDTDSGDDDDDNVPIGFEGFRTCADGTVNVALNERKLSNVEPTRFQCGAIDVANQREVVSGEWFGGFSTRWSVCALDDVVNPAGEEVYFSSFEGTESINFQDPLFGAAVGGYFENGKVASGRWVDDKGLIAVDLTIALENGELQQLWWQSDDDFETRFDDFSFANRHRTLNYSSDDDDNTTVRTDECEKHVEEFFPGFFQSLIPKNIININRSDLSPPSSSSASALMPAVAAALAIVGLIAVF